MTKEYLYNSKNIPKYIEINETKIGRDKIIIAGPCTFGSYEEVYSIAKKLKKEGIKFFRAGAYKARTNPYSYQGMRDEGIKILLKIKKELNLSIVTELMTVEQVKKYGKDIDIIQVGSRNMYNYELLKELGKLNKPILLKRGFMSTYEEWLLAAEYILKEGNYKVILCERGIRGFNSNETRNILDILFHSFTNYNNSITVLIVFILYYPSQFPNNTILFC